MNANTEGIGTGDESGATAPASTPEQAGNSTAQAVRNTIQARGGADNPGEAEAPVAWSRGGVPRRSPSPSGLRGPGASSNRKGVLPKRAVRTATCAVVSLAIFACAALCLLAVWDYASQGVPWRAIASLGIVAGAMGAFSVVNEVCGMRVEDAD